ncbi:MAG TPA: J domain-containing protein [Alphaproteobacteria bacterium]|nr:J domain-containing protein [Alphaproteobacteria bacterium]
MAIIKIKGCEINAIPIRDSFSRRAIQYRNNIFKLLINSGINEDDIDIPLESVAMKKAPASVDWYAGDNPMHYSFNGCSKFVENLYVVQKLLEIKTAALMDGEITPEDYIAEFREERDVAERRRKAREVLGLDEKTMDVEAIDKAYKTLAKEHHPDTPTGDVIKFKEINNAHKTLKRELM